MTAVGVDGCRGGWIAAWIDPAGQRGFHVYPHFDQILSLDADQIMIDIPIGLPQSGYRACDMAARVMLGKARSRVFLGVRRPLLQFVGDYVGANRWAKSNGKGISKQIHAILPKIAEVDAIMSPEQQWKVRETHPELVFHRLNGGIWLPNKKKEEGRKLRRDLVARAGFDAIDDWLLRLRGSGARTDDLLDACACALVAADASKRLLACAPELDAKGLRMEMWF